MFLCRLAYISEPVWSSPAPERILRELKGILAAGLANNPRQNLTGTLIFDGRYFIQVLEGRRDTVYATFRRISADPRHRNVLLAGFYEAEERLFRDWSVLTHPPREGQPARSSILDPDVLSCEMLVSYAVRQRGLLSEMRRLELDHRACA